MKNSVVCAMIKSQFSWATDVTVECLACMGTEYEFKVNLYDGELYREFKLLINLKEV